MTTSRDSAIVALVRLVASAYAWKSGPVRKLKLWSDVPAAARPACFVFEGGLESYAWSEGAVPKRVIEPKLFIYLSARGDTPGASLLNGVMDALDQAFALSGADLGLGRNTLSGAAYSCRIDGKVLKDPGDLDGDALLVVPVRIVLA
ncbi:MAG: hypothetical protein P4L68_01085 [Methylovirgula sp.]|nr:hypothetical protein [Methylovirgula sp.]